MEEFFSSSHVGYGGLLQRQNLSLFLAANRAPFFQRSELVTGRVFVSNKAPFTHKLWISWAVVV